MGGERRLFWVALGLKVFFVSVILALGCFSYSHRQLVNSWLEMYLNWVRSTGNWSALLFTVVYTIITVFFVPAELLNISGGFVFSAIYGRPAGFYVAFLSCELGTYGSSIICFSLSRYFFYNNVYMCFRGYRMYQALSRAVEEGGTCFVALVRLSPIIPLTLTNYLFGVTTLRMRQLLLGSLSSIILTSIFVWIGTELNDMRQIPAHTFQMTWKSIALICFGLTMAIVALVYITYLTRRRLASAYDNRGETVLLLEEGGIPGRTPSQHRRLSYVDGHLVTPTTGGGGMYYSSQPSLSLWREPVVAPERAVIEAVDVCSHSNRNQRGLSSHNHQHSTVGYVDIGGGSPLSAPGGGNVNSALQCGNNMHEEEGAMGTGSATGGVDGAGVGGCSGARSPAPSVIPNMNTKTAGRGIGKTSPDIPSSLSQTGVSLMSYNSSSLKDLSPSATITHQPIASQDRGDNSCCETLTNATSPSAVDNTIAEAVSTTSSTISADSGGRRLHERSGSIGCNDYHNNNSNTKRGGSSVGQTGGGGAGPCNKHVIKEVEFGKKL
eukprot:GHVQ01027713.1.p1 GENE.GHVQ01027713.1~~GHVQ01027713.1.p1  ORF type:complete len:551 (+),score=80.75 GHVQ01027713.1:153-1805(+)